MHIYILTLNIVFNFDEKRRGFGNVYRAHCRVHTLIRIYTLQNDCFITIEGLFMASGTMA